MEHNTSQKYFNIQAGINLQCSLYDRLGSKPWCLFFYQPYNHKIDQQTLVGNTPMMQVTDPSTARSEQKPNICLQPPRQGRTGLERRVRPFTIEVQKEQNLQHYHNNI
jgi:hypothetical protein